MSNEFRNDASAGMDQWAPHILDDRKIIELLIRELYGDDPYVSIREMLQNAHDAVAKLETTSGQLGGGRVEVSVEVDGGRRCVIIRDNGIGMSRDDLRTKLLAIGESGKSTWVPTSESDSVDQLKRIVTTQANAIGRYGIGFLAAFILAEEVLVRTRHHEMPEDEGWELRATLGHPRPPRLIPLPQSGTEVRLYVRATAGNPGFTGKVNQLLKPDHLERHIRRLLYFSNVPIYFKAADGLRLISMDVPSIEELQPEPLFGILTGTEGGSGSKPLRAKRFRCRLDDQALDSECYVYLYFWDSSTPQNLYGSLHVWVDNMLVEENATDILPKWAVNITAFVVAKRLPMELDRRAIQRTSMEFIKLRQSICDHCLRLFEEEIDRDFEKFAWDVWPVLQGAVLPNALLSYFQPDRFTNSAAEHREAGAFLRRIGPKWPFNALVLNSRFNVYYRKVSSIEKIAALTPKASSPLEVPYLLAGGTTEAALNPERIGKPAIIDVRIASSRSEEKRFGMGANHGLALLNALNGLLKEQYNFSELLPDVGERLTEEELAQGWSALSKCFQDHAQYKSSSEDGVTPGMSERYLISVRRFKPAHYPAVAAELTGSDNDMEQVGSALEELIKRFPQFRDQIKTDLFRKNSPHDRVHSLILNAENSLLQAMAAEIGKTPAIAASEWFRLLAVQQIEDARTDFFGGSLMGRAAQDQIYSCIRMPLYERFWKMATDALDLSQIPVTPLPRHAVVLQADLTGSTSVLQALDRADWGKILGEFASRMAAFVERNDGFFDKFTGDGFLAFWLEDVSQSHHDYFRMPGRVMDLLPELLNEFKRFQKSDAVRDTLISAGLQTTDFKPRVAVGFGPVQFGRFGRAGSAVGRTVVQVARMVDSGLSYWTSTNCMLDEQFIHAARCNPDWIQEHRHDLKEGIRDFPGIKAVYRL